MPKYAWIRVSLYQTNTHIKYKCFQALQIQEAGRSLSYLSQLTAGLNVTGSLQCVASDMTAFYLTGVYYELTLFMDLWNNEIFSYSLSAWKGDRMTYISGLNGLIDIKKNYPEFQLELYTDQGSVYSSKSLNDLLPLCNIVHSMSRAGTSTDNAAMEAING